MSSRAPALQTEIWKGISRWALALGLVYFLWLPLLASAKTIDELRAELEAKRQQLEQAQANIGKFAAQLKQKKQQAATLVGQITLLDDNIEEVELSLDRTRLEIETTALQIDTVLQEIAEREAEISHSKSKLAEYIRMINTLDQQSSVTIFLKYQSFSEAVTDTAAYEELQNRGQRTLNTIQQLRDELNTKRRQLEEFKDILDSLRVRQEREQSSLTSQRESKTTLLTQTHAQEAQYQDLLAEAKRTHEAAQAEIQRIDTQLRAELAARGLGNLPSVGTMSWPIDPIYGVTCEFRCANYPYAYLIGPHTGMDIPAHVGTPIRAPADGYVGRVYDSGGRGYSYILLLHGGNISTVFGHVSGFAVTEGQSVTRGTIIGFTGGAPGSRGSGLSTGPHLHFEVRSANTPVNPRQYL